MLFVGRNFFSKSKNILVAALILLSAMSAAPCAASDLRVGSIAPDFELKTFGGKKFRLSDEIGKHPIMLIFWSYFCFPCQKEMLSIEELYKELAPTRLSIMGICLDGPEYDAKVLPFLEKNSITFPNAYDVLEGRRYGITDSFGVIGTPTIYLLDMHGRIRLAHLGRLNPDVAKSLLVDIEKQTFCAEILRPDGEEPQASSEEKPKEP